MRRAPAKRCGRRRGRGRAPRRGFTLTELLVTLGVVVVVLSLSMGVLSRVGQKEEIVAVQQAVRALLRRARNAAREERYRVTVEIDAENGEMRAQQKTSVTQFRFEADGTPQSEGASAGEHGAGGGPNKDAQRSGREPERFLVQGARGYELTAEEVDRAQGRFGQGLLFERTDPRGAAWAWIGDRPALNPREGVHLSCWVLLGRLSQRLYERKSQEGREEGREDYKRSGPTPRAAAPRLLDYDLADPPLFYVMRKGRAFSLAVTASYELEAAVTGTTEGGDEVTYVARTRAQTLRPDRWTRLELAFDGRLLRVIVNGIARYLVPIPGNDVLPQRLLEDPSPVSLSDPDPRQAFFGVIDELKFAAVISSTRVSIPKDIALLAPGPTLRFDQLGQLDPASHAEPFVIYLCNAPDVAEIIDPAPAEGVKTGTRTRTQQKEEDAGKAKILLGGNQYERFVRQVDEVSGRQVRRLVVDRTGLVTE